MKKDTSNPFIQMTTRVYQGKNPRLHQLLEKMEGSHSDLITMLAEQAIKMACLENEDPRDILNGTCYARPITLGENLSHSTETSKDKKVDSALSDEIINLGILK